MISFSFSFSGSIRLSLLNKKDKHVTENYHLELRVVVKVNKQILFARISSLVPKLLVKFTNVWMRQYHQATSAGHTMIGYAVAQIIHYWNGNRKSKMLYCIMQIRLDRPSITNHCKRNGQYLAVCWKYFYMHWFPHVIIV